MDFNNPIILQRQQLSIANMKPVATEGAQDSMPNTALHAAPQGHAFGATSGIHPLDMFKVPAHVLLRDETPIRYVFRVS